MSKQIPTLPDSAPFSGSQKSTLSTLVESLDSAQYQWLSGYFAALGGFGSQVSATTSTAAPNTAAASATRKLTILYGTESGNSESCAAEAVKAASAAGFKASMVDMGDYDHSRLAAEENLLVIVSTWGEGDPPERAVDFHAFVMGDKAPRLENFNYSVCALGDRSYADFCTCGIQFDERLSALGANRVRARVECDVDYEGLFKAWLSEALSALSAGYVTEAAVATVIEPTPIAHAIAEPYGKKRPFPAPILTKINLNGTGSAKETFHLELSLEGSGLSYEPGDVVGIFPHNCPEVVDDVLRVAGYQGDESVEQDNAVHKLSEILTEHHDITSINPALMKKYAASANNPQLDRLLEPSQKADLSAWLYGREVRDLFADFPPSEPLPITQFLGLLRKMPPRLYSIASSLRAHPDEVHLTVGTVRYESYGRQRKGVCSTFLADLLEVGDTVPLYTHANKNFNLPTDSSTPIIMVGPGTGIAPFRAFVEERAAIGAKGRNWLFFGDQHFNTDFLYQIEWQDYLKSGVLTRMDVAFSRDTDHKVYVQHRMKDRAREIYGWLQEGAHFYVCGDASRMAKDVHSALIEIFMEQGDLPAEAAEAAVKQLQKDKRYQRDVY